MEAAISFSTHRPLLNRILLNSFTRTVNFLPLSLNLFQLRTLSHQYLSHLFIFSAKQASSKQPEFGRNCNNLFSLNHFFLSFNSLSLLENKGERRRKREWKAKAFSEWPLMAVMVEHVIGSRDWVVTKSVWHLNDEEIKNDPFYDGESYRKDGGDGSVHWLYEKQEDIEEQARAELWREELIEEIEKKVGGLRELEEAKEEELVK